MLRALEIVAAAGDGAVPGGGVARAGEVSGGGGKREEMESRGRQSSWRKDMVGKRRLLDQVIFGT